MTPRVLFVEDEAPFRRFAGSFLEENGFRVTYAADAHRALEAFEASPPDLVLLDLNLPDLHGLEVLRRMRRDSPDLRVVVLTSYGDAANAVSALKTGATDYLTKPVELDALLAATREALEASSAIGARAAAVEPPPAPLAPRATSPLLGEHPRWLEVVSRLETIAGSGLPTVLLGESGTGKTTLARRFHELSGRPSGPLIEVDVPSIPLALLESELFGYEQANGLRKRGQVERAAGGTLFLDEIGDLPTALQAKLLRFLDEHTFRRVGGEQTLVADVRLVCATNRDLKRAVEGGALRRDLYYRLEAASIELPPLRERGEDVLLLTEHFLEEIAARNDRQPHELTEGARRALLEHTFPGNIRGLKIGIQRSAAFARETTQLDASDLDLGAAAKLDQAGPSLLQPVDLEIALNALEAHYVEQAMARTTSQRKAGALLALDRFALARRRNRINRAGGREGADRTLAAAPSWIRTLLRPHPGDLPAGGLDLLALRGELEDRAISAALRATGNNRARAATLLGMSRTSLSRRLEGKQS